MHKSNSTRKQESNQTIMTRSRARAQRERATQKTIKKKRSVSVPEQGVDFWKIGDTVKPSGMPDPGYKIVGDGGDYWVMEGEGGRYSDNIPKSNEGNGWEKCAPLKKRYKRKSKSKRMKSKRMKSKRMKSKRRKSKPLLTLNSQTLILSEL